MNIERAKTVLKNAIIHEIDLISCEGYAGQSLKMDLTSYEDLWAEHCPSAPLPKGLIPLFLDDEEIIEELERTANNGWVILTITEDGIAMEFNDGAFIEWERDCIEEKRIEEYEETARNG